MKIRVTFQIINVALEKKKKNTLGFSLYYFLYCHYFHILGAFFFSEKNTNIAPQMTFPLHLRLRYVSTHKLFPLCRSHICEILLIILCCFAGFGGYLRRLCPLKGLKASFYDQDKLLVVGVRRDIFVSVLWLVKTGRGCFRLEDGWKTDQETAFTPRKRKQWLFWWN